MRGKPRPEEAVNSPARRRTTYWTVCLAATMAMALAACQRQSPPDVVAATANEPTAAAQSVDTASTPGEPVTLHAWISLKNRTNAGGGAPPMRSSFDLELWLEAPARKAQNQKTVQFMLDDSLPVQSFHGTAHARGESSLNADGVSQETHVEMDGEWPTPTHLNANANADAAAGARMLAPSPASAGEGLSSRIDIDLPLTGTATQTLRANGHTLTEAPQMLGLDCDFPDTRHARCKLALSLDPPLGKAADPIGQQVADEMKARLNAAPNAPALLALQGLLFNLQTEWLANGHFVARSNGQYSVSEGTTLARDVHVILWSTARGDSRKPAGVPG